VTDAELLPPYHKPINVFGNVSLKNGKRCEMKGGQKGIKGEYKVLRE